MGWFVHPVSLPTIESSLKLPHSLGIRPNGLDRNFRRPYVVPAVLRALHDPITGQADLDADSILRGRPIVLKRVDVHAIWASQRAVELAKEAHGGELPTTVEGGEIVRDKNGHATGTSRFRMTELNVYTRIGVFVDNAMDLIPVPPWSEAQMDDYFQRTMTDALQHGLTSIHDALSDPSYIKFFMKYAPALIY
jgi:predicted amidohydrolase YtcJ